MKIRFCIGWSFRKPLSTGIRLACCAVVMIASIYIGQPPVFGDDDWDKKRTFPNYQFFCEELRKAAEVAERDERSGESWVKNALVPGEWVIRFIKETKNDLEPPAIRIKDSIILGGLDFTKLEPVPIEEVPTPEGWSDEDIKEFKRNREKFYIVLNSLIIANSIIGPFHYESSGVNTVSNPKFFKERQVGATNTIVFFKSIDFKFTQFTGFTCFWGARFAGSATFGGAQFTDGVNFGGTQFFDGAYFWGARFTGNTDFGDARFNNNAHFGGARFNAVAEFRDARFLDEAFFWGARFTDDADFGSVQFNGSTSFGGAQFTEDADFGSVQFTSDAAFWGAKFNGDADFGSAKFNGGAIFASARFDFINFSRVDFNDFIDLQNTYARKASFIASVSKKPANFWKSFFSERLSLSEARFYDRIDFREIGQGILIGYAIDTQR